MTASDVFDDLFLKLDQPECLKMQRLGIVLTSNAFVSHTDLVVASMVYDALSATDRLYFRMKLPQLVEEMVDFGYPMET